MTRLQGRVKELEREKKLLQREVELRDDLHGMGDASTRSLVETEREIYETIKVRPPGRVRQNRGGRAGWSVPNYLVEQPLSNVTNKLVWLAFDKKDSKLYVCLSKC